MKTAIYLIVLSFLLAANACRRNDTKPAPVTPKEQLPPYTETGANTFGCLIDGEVFVPKKKLGSLSISLQCYYQYSSGNYVFGLRAGDYVNEMGYRLFFVGSDSSDFLEQGKTYVMSNTDIGSTIGKVIKGKEEYYTNLTINGTMTVLYLDKTKQIVSGVFNYDAIDTTTGIVKHVTDGRFDFSYYK